MTRFRTIEIDIEVHKRIEAERISFDEPDIAPLRRLLGLGPLECVPASDRPYYASWRDDGVELPHGTPLRMKHLRGRQIFEGMVKDGKLSFQDQLFGTVSGAASALAITSKGSKTNLNGWDKIEAKLDENDQWTLLSILRRKNYPAVDLSKINISFDQ